MHQWNGFWRSVSDEDVTRVLEEVEMWRVEPGVTEYDDEGPETLREACR